MEDKSFSRRLALNSAILKNKYWVLPVDYTGHENYEPVGRGVKTSSVCGRWVSFMTCKNMEGHKGELLGVEDATGKVVVANKHLWCRKSSCPVCFVRGWSVRGARRVLGRMLKAVELGLGDVEHIVVSPPVADRDLPEYVLRKKVRAVLFNRGVVGGAMIFHGYSKNKEHSLLVWKPHYHVLGFVLGGFDRCRNCVHERGDCVSCSGFKGREVRGFEEDGYLVKVLAKREKSFYDDKDNIFGTAFYQLHHSTIKLGVKRFHVVTYFGVCGNRKFKSDVLRSEPLCPVCGEEMSRDVYVGKEHFVKDVAHPDYRAVFLVPEFGVDGEPNFMGAVGSRGG